ncbi:hypothetical protein HMPREF0733_10249 [Rothia dentocariosa ATCC 17931]|uniref:Uncharacterized protein n=1 Tax=Rothia dentocariosa (strain ATCC 17931 / CDC X599 / XDIA) TaxID=762948 RepID=E3H5L7_ROTDC|nr:hypothetical protein HMPREF0733_10249 [Rothia dentocariosa ATCC 17931]
MQKAWMLRQVHGALAYYPVRETPPSKRRAFLTGCRRDSKVEFSTRSGAVLNAQALGLNRFTNF